MVNLVTLFFPPEIRNTHEQNALVNVGGRILGICRLCHRRCYRIGHQCHRERHPVHRWRNHMGTFDLPLLSSLPPHFPSLLDALTEMISSITPIRSSYPSGTSSSISSAADVVQVEEDILRQRQGEVGVEDRLEQGIKRFVWLDRIYASSTFYMERAFFQFPPPPLPSANISSTSVTILSLDSSLCRESVFSCLKIFMMSSLLFPIPKSKTPFEFFFPVLATPGISISSSGTYPGHSFRDTECNILDARATPN
ncbi:uncharacterized protein EI90DRAFT_1647457 [Cantharellus anzutake]|uniref:uncharacterized protein n=1 Tax=Cantharellus anzutake TaxID=1750568 RepID=UPI00190753EF|nr:uncharacterized protein EI90DRAFT_1647457 [Cantharellus anzutake]KAF8327941.1 hypothetical protein EI90DRAFT_1647457 [Cantharellus anzutake]